jgi:GMP synthase (glutamine-hydrolysing)
LRVLGIIHQDDAGPGVFTDAIRDAGARLDSWLLPRAREAPGDPLGYDAVLTFGGAMHPDQQDRHPWIAAETALLSDLISREIPVLGVCLGAELLAEAAGGTARRAAMPEIGWYEIETTDEAARDPLLASLAPGFEALEWHSYEISLPTGAVALARSARSLQAYRVGRCAWGIQFHAEVTSRDFDAWLDDFGSDPDAAELEVDALRSRTRESIMGWNQLGRELCARFLAAAG